MCILWYTLSKVASHYDFNVLSMFLLVMGSKKVLMGVSVGGDVCQ